MNRALLSSLEKCLLLVPSSAGRLGAASAILRAFGCRWRLSLRGASGDDAALWLLGERGDAALVDAAACERLARAAGKNLDAIAQVLQIDLQFSTVITNLRDHR